MNVPIRMIGLATTFFWIFLIAFTATVAYSAKDLQFSFGELQVGGDSHNNLVLSLPIGVVNQGYYDIDAFNISTYITDLDGFRITRGSTFTPVIAKGGNITIYHNVTLSIDRLLRHGRNYLLNDTTMNVNESVSMRLANFIPVQASANFSIPWGAPLYNFELGDPTYSPYNLTHFSVVVPISFENHASFDVVGNVQASMYNDADMQTGTGQTTINAAQHSSFNGLLEFYVQMSNVTPTGRFEVNFQTSLFDYGPLVIPYG
ncbi:MAG TPA: hypothetical protein VMT01_01340 [Candidatus Acidoferrum sp.]|jgi:hypothetical protein|nr:hypothetical protein [Candidatus Acidoferrum sp.]